MIAKYWEWVSVPIGMVCAVVLIFLLAAKITSEPKCDFCPLELANLEVMPNPVVIGQSATLKDGLCNKSKEPVPTTILMILEPRAPVLTGGSVELVNDMRNIDSKTCVVSPDSPIPVAKVPDTLPIGVYRLTVRVTARSEAGQTQILTRSSNYFTIKEP